MRSAKKVRIVLKQVESLSLYTHTFLFYERYRDRAEKGSGITRRNIVEINQSDGTGKTPMDGFPREWFLHLQEGRVKFSYLTSFNRLECIPEARLAIGVIDCGSRGLLIWVEGWLLANLTSGWKESPLILYTGCYSTRVNEIIAEIATRKKNHAFSAKWYVVV